VQLLAIALLAAVPFGAGLSFAAVLRRRDSVA
jgi:hypothetical protein